MDYFDSLISQQKGGNKNSYFDSLLPAQAQPEQPKEKEPSYGTVDAEISPDTTGNLIGGAIRGAASIGSTLVAPYDIAQDAIDGKGLSLESNRQRRKDIDTGLTMLGVNINSPEYHIGKIGSEVAGTMGVGGALAKGAGSIPYIADNAPALVEALRTGGMNTGVELSPLKDLAARIVGGAANGSISAGAVDPSQTANGAIVGVAAPGVIKSSVLVGNKILNTVTGGGVSPEIANLAQKASSLGIDIPADRIANSKPLNAIASSLNYVPFSGRTTTEEVMKDQLKRALSGTFGQQDSNISRALLNAEADLGGKFEAALSGNNVKIDDELLNALASISEQAQNELTPEYAGIINRQIDNIMNKGSNGEIEGNAAYNIKKTLDKIGNRNSSEAYYAREVKRYLMDALNRSMTPEDAAAFAKTRQQYGNMLDVSPLALNGAEGDVSVGRLANLRGVRNQDLKDVVDITNQFVKDREGAHGAAQRISIPTIIGGLLLSPLKVGALIAGSRAGNIALNSDALRRAVIEGSKASGDPMAQALLKYNPLLYQSGQLTSASSPP